MSSRSDITPLKKSNVVGSEYDHELGGLRRGHKFDVAEIFAGSNVKFVGFRLVASKEQTWTSTEK